MSDETETLEAEESEEKSRHDMIRELADAEEARAAPAEELAEEPEEPEEPEKKGSERDEKGRFKAKDSEEPEEVAEEPKPTKYFPRSWEKQAQELWKDLPEAVKLEVEKREGQIFDGIDQYRQKAKSFEELNQVISPYLANIQAQGLNPAQAIQHLLSADHVLRTSNPQQKLQYFNKLAQYYQVDLGGQAEAEEGDPALSELKNELYSVKQELAKYQQESQRAATAPLISEIEQFRAGHDHFDTLRPVMAALLESGAASDLQSAYDQALYANPELRQQALAKQQEAAKAKEQKRVEAAKRASVSVKGAPSSAPAKVNVKDRRAAIAAAMENLDR